MPAQEFLSKILIVDDDHGLRETLGDFLGQEGYDTLEAANVAEARVHLRAGAPDLLLLDLNMPGGDGLSFAAEVRASASTPIIIISGKGQMVDRVVGLELGADDYLAKPFSPRELLARLRAVLRRTQAAQGERINLGSLSVDVEARSVRVSDALIDLTGLEFDLLVALVRRAGRVVPRSALLELAGRSDVTVSDRTVDVHVSHLRKKLGDDPPKLIRTVRGVGYQVVKDEA